MPRFLASEGQAMNRYLVIALLLLSTIALELEAQNAMILFVKGEALVLQASSGYKHKAWLGERIAYNDTLLTGPGSQIDLQIDNDLITLKENTVFKLMEINQAEKKQNAYHCALGQINLKINRIAGTTGPRITSGSTYAGVKGTEFSVYTGLDGSTLITVAKGEVEVFSQQETVVVASNEGIEVKPGSRPGQKFTVQNPIDYKSWNDERLKDFLADPLGAIQNIRKVIADYSQVIKPLFKDYQKLREELKLADEKFNALKAQLTKEEAQAYHLANIKPLEIKATQLYLEIRFNALSALSLRRYVASRLYLLLKTEYATNLQDKVYLDFLNNFKSLVTLFDEEIARFIGEQDI